MKKIALLFVAVLFSTATFAQTKYTVDTYHSFLTFSVGHLGISFVDGKMDTYQGYLGMKDEEITSAKYAVITNERSLNRGIAIRDHPLRSADLFEVDKHKEIRFVFTSIKKQGKNYQLNGNLSIKDV